jgi:hypothetical protein
MGRPVEANARRLEIEGGRSRADRDSGDGGALIGVGCERQGPTERAGQKIDRAVEEAKDKLDPAGPAEKAGKAVDRTVEDLTK